MKIYFRPLLKITFSHRAGKYQESPGRQVMLHVEHLHFSESLLTLVLCRLQQSSKSYHAAHQKPNHVH